MKKKVVLIFVIASLLVLAILPVFTGCTKRANQLKVLSWDEYLDESLISEFEDYYFKITGEKVKVSYDSCPTNEIMYSKIATKQSDYDVICPSDYMVEKLKSESLLNELTVDFGTDVNGETIEDYRKNVSPYLTGSTFDAIDNAYTCPYMWGTLGIVYNKDVISTESITAQGWGALWNSAYSGKIQMKDSVRDSYAAASVYTYKDAIAANTMTVAQAVNATSDTNLSEVKTTLLNQRSLVYGYETDNGKTDIVEGKSNLLLQWSGDAVYTLSDEHQDEVGKHPNLGYIVPNEGSNVWCDYWVIPKYSVNTTAANLWINFMCSDKAALANMDYIGYTSAIATEATFEYAQADESETDTDRYQTVDLSYFFTGIEDSDAVFTDTIQYPSASIIARCAVMVDFGAEKIQAITDLWTSVKASK